MSTLYTFAPASGHYQTGHPEHPDRLGLLDFAGIIPALAWDGIIPGIQALSFSAATRAEVERVHTVDMLTRLEAACQRGPSIIDSAPTYVTGASYQAALLAAGACRDAARAVINGQADNAFAIVRPPGHHAEPERAMGFCLLNNVAIAGLDALAGGVERIMVVDYDAHHGNGTEKAFWNNPRAAYFSTHQENIYPGTGRLQDAPHARGRLANFPLPAHTGDESFSLIFDQALAPLVKAFRPGLILVSAGFDAHWSDPLTSLGLSTAGFLAISKKLVRLAEEICSGKIVFVLEGGYDPLNLSNGIRAVFGALTGQDPAPVADRSKYPEPETSSLRISQQIETFRTWHGI